MLPRVSLIWPIGPISTSPSGKWAAANSGKPDRRAADGTATVSFPRPDLSGGFFPALPRFAPVCDSVGAPMDPPPRVARGERRSACSYLLRCLLTFSLFAVLCFSSVFVFGFFALSGDRFPVPRRPIAFAAQCKIVSSSECRSFAFVSVYCFFVWC